MSRQSEVNTVFLTHPDYQGEIRVEMEGENYSCFDADTDQPLSCPANIHQAVAELITFDYIRGRGWRCFNRLSGQPVKCPPEIANLPHSLDAPENPEYIEGTRVKFFRAKGWRCVDADGKMIVCPSNVSRVLQRRTQGLSDYEN